MKWVRDNRAFIRVTTLILFILSLTGPWLYDVIMVPPEYPCGKPTVRLEGDFCGYPMPGFQVFSGFVVGFFHIIFQLLAGTFPGRFRELLIGLSLLPLIPFVITILLLWKRETPSLRTINLIAWGLGCIIPLVIFIAEWSVQTVRLWGLWLYILVAVGIVIFEIILMRTDPIKAE